jgi:hypothetical protein
MLRKLRSRLTYANVMSTIAVFVAVGTGGAYAANTVFSTDIVDGEVKTADIGNGEVKSTDVKDESLTTFDVSTFLGVDIVDGSLDDQDVGQTTFVALDALIGQVNANACSLRPVTGIDVQPGDHIIVTPQTSSADANLIYTAQYSGAGEAIIKVCNPTTNNIEDLRSNLSLLVFDAQ